MALTIKTTESSARFTPDVTVTPDNKLVLTVDIDQFYAACAPSSTGKSEGVNMNMRFNVPCTLPGADGERVPVTLSTSSGQTGSCWFSASVTLRK